MKWKINNFMKAAYTNTEDKEPTVILFPTLSDEDISALDAFRKTILDAAEAAAVELVDKLSSTYSGMDIDYFVCCIDDAIEEFTYETMVNEEVDDDDDYPNCSY